MILVHLKGEIILCYENVNFLQYCLSNTKPFSIASCKVSLIIFSLGISSLLLFLIRCFGLRKQKVPVYFSLSPFKATIVVAKNGTRFLFFDTIKYFAIVIV